MIALMARHITGKRKDINKMYNFVEEKSENTPILNYDILEIENKYNIIFPTILKEYYLMHNGDKIKLCIFTVDEEEFGVAKIVELKYGNCSFEKIVNNDREDGFIDEHLYPLARNEGGDYFYWDVRDENVYMIYCDDIENPVWVCESIKAFFELMENN